ncbi:hypothetical protein ACH436_01925 [Isoptericola sp. NPDC019693]|uniref:hypothetical protein n=1 Tax=Isoptericola sp. NPDC019693 TaxID=3364009 RepID=UPI00378F4D24
MKRGGGELPNDEVTTELRRLASALRTELGDSAEISGPTVDGGVEGLTVSSATDGSVEVWLMHDANSVAVGLDGCPGWDLPRTLESVVVVRAIIDAAAAGRVEVGTGRRVRSYRVPMPDGTVMEDNKTGVLAAMLEMPWKPRMRWGTSAAYGA